MYPKLTRVTAARSLNSPWNEEEEALKEVAQSKASGHITPRAGCVSPEPDKYPAATSRLYSKSLSLKTQNQETQWGH